MISALAATAQTGSMSFGATTERRNLRGSSRPAGGTYQIPHVGPKKCEWIPWRKETLCVDGETGKEFTPKVNPKAGDHKVPEFKLPA